jgi:hypothetical protein
MGFWDWLRLGASDEDLIKKWKMKLQAAEDQLKNIKGDKKAINSVVKVKAEIEAIKNKLRELGVKI